ncbi:MAG: PDZ domain-containing protein, partial [Candidatus Zixiibacteriota bacterium]
LSGSLVGLVVGGIGPSNRPEVGLAIPAHAIPDIVRHLLIEGDRPVGYIGVTTADIEISPPVKLSPVNRMAASAAPATDLLSRGILVTEVVPGGPAAVAGLREGDVLVSMDGIRLRSALDLRNRVRQSYPGTIVELGFVRLNSLFRTFMKIGELRSDAEHRSFVQPTREPTRQTMADSIRSEIKLLKTRLHRLEQQLENLGR